MITQWVLSFAVALINFILGLLPSGTPPSWIGTAADYTGTMWSSAADLGAWIPWSLGATVVGSWFACLGIALAIRTVRMLLSLFTGGGGAG